jgi:hypothetical protein
LLLHPFDAVHRHGSARGGRSGIAAGVAARIVAAGRLATFVSTLAAAAEKIGLSVPSEGHGQQPSQYHIS